MIDINNCCGCSACKVTCPTNAIKMIQNKEGFQEPFVDKDKCIECGKCIRICAMNKIPLNDYSQSVYAAYHNNNEVHMASRSGGVFVALSDYIIDNNGSVYGCGYDNNFTVIHKRAINKKDRNEFQGSKYVQSDLREIFEMVIKDLNENMLVLFSGTPCQVAGLLNILNDKQKENLFTVDIVCHGVPSPLVWKEYLNYLENKYEGKVTKVDFRNKSKFGWSKHIESIWIDNIQHDSREYTKLFYTHCLIRPSCYKCPYKTINRPSDISLGDYWGINEIIQLPEYEKGTSLVLVNSEKGQNVFNIIKNDLWIKETTIEQATKKQHPLKAAFPKPKEREEIWSNFNKRGIEYVIKRYSTPNLYIRVIKKIKKILKK